MKTWRFKTVDNSPGGLLKSQRLQKQGWKISCTEMLFTRLEKEVETKEPKKT